jgi:monofunctional biosynthetic peptidoglycan transglycosylase
VREEEVWSGPDAGAPQVESVAERAGAAELAAPDGGRVFAANETVPAATEPRAETVAAAAPWSIWLPRIAPPAPSGTAPPSAEPASLAWPAHLRRAAIIVSTALAALVAGVLLLILAYRWIDPPTSTLMLGQRLTGTKIEQTWVPLDRISVNLMHAVILSEDGGFCRHRGVDWAALSLAIEDDRGGSTITMQVVKNLFLWPGRSYVRKALEIMLAYLVEAVWPKQRVLEIYLNIAEWGPGIFGAEAAARQHFGKPASRLTAQEAALLAVALPSPLERESGYPGTQQRRLASNLLTRMRAVRTRPCVPVRRSDI